MDIRQYVIDDLSYEDSWRLFKIIAEFVDGFDTLKKCWSCSIHIWLCKG